MFSKHLSVAADVLDRQMKQRATCGMPFLFIFFFSENCDGIRTVTLY